jgi:hypothetical protein
MLNCMDLRMLWRKLRPVIYLRLEDTFGVIHMSLVMSKTKVASIKRVMIPRIELNRALITAQLLYHRQPVVLGSQCLRGLTPQLYCDG